MGATGPVPNTLTGAASSASSRGSPWWYLGAAAAAHRAQQRSSLVCCSNSCACPTHAFSTWAATHLKLRRPLIPLGGRFCMQQSRLQPRVGRDQWGLPGTLARVKAAAWRRYPAVGSPLVSHLGRAARQTSSRGRQDHSPGDAGSAISGLGFRPSDPVDSGQLSTLAAS